MSTNNDNILVVDPPKKNREGEMCGASGTQIRTKNGMIIEGVREINIELAANEVIQAQMSVFVNLCSQFTVVPYMDRMWAQDPMDGIVKYISKIEFEDGKVLEAGE